MAILRVDIERALDELVWQENGMRFQGLAVALAKKRWPELIARQRNRDFGLDAYAPAGLTPEKIEKGLAASVTPTLKKVSDDAREAKDECTDLQALLFVTSAKVGNADRERWEQPIRKDYGLELHIIEREEIISTLLMLRIHSDTRLNRSALPMTDTELKVIAALAIIGLRHLLHWLRMGVRVAHHAVRDSSGGVCWC